MSDGPNWTSDECRGCRSMLLDEERDANGGLCMGCADSVLCDSCAGTGREVINGHECQEIVQCRSCGGAGS